MLAADVPISTLCNIVNIVLAMVSSKSFFWHNVYRQICISEPLYNINSRIQKPVCAQGGHSFEQLFMGMNIKPQLCSV
jgi:hypothetical protein